MTRFWTLIENCPSCGRRRSAMSSFDRILMREMIALKACFGGARPLVEHAVDAEAERRRARRSFSIWMSERAPGWPASGWR